MHGEHNTSELGSLIQNISFRAIRKKNLGGKGCMLIAITSYPFVLDSNSPLFSFSDRIASIRFTLATLGAIRSEAVVWPCHE